MNDVIDAPARVRALDVEAVRAQFPILSTEMNGQPLVFLDSAASAQKPTCVIEAHKQFLEHDYANIHRGIYDLSQRASAAHDAARRTAQRFIGARDWREIVFTRNATEAINLVAWSFLEPLLGAGDEILITEMEHHANIVPWQMLAARTGARVVWSPIDDQGDVVLDAFEERLSARTKLVAFPWISNVLGTINPVEELVALARARGIPVLIDAAQVVQHKRVDVAALGCDFLVFSGHKIYGPSGMGVLYAKDQHLEAMRPYQGGGDMIERVSFEGVTFNEIPFKFEAGTPDIAGAVALGRAIEWLDEVGLERVDEHESALLAYALRAINQVPGLDVIGTPREKASVIAFTLQGAHPQDVGTMLDLDGIAVRTGHHCAMPLHDRLGLTASTRASIGVYNNEDDIDALVSSLKRVSSMFA